MAFSNLEKREINVALAEEALKDIISPDEKREVTPELIITTVAEHFHVSENDIKGPKRNSEIVLPRQIAMYLCREMTNTSLEAVGALMGKKDHSTVINGCKKITEKMESSESIRNSVEVIKKKLSPG
jgi:chromosomal replication initiator protein